MHPKKVQGQRCLRKWNHLGLGYDKYAFWQKIVLKSLLDLCPRLKEKILKKLMDSLRQQIENLE